MTKKKTGRATAAAPIAKPRKQLSQLAPRDRRDRMFAIPSRRIPMGWAPQWASGVYIPDAEEPTEPVAMFEYRDQACAFVYHQMPQAEVRLLATGERIYVSAMHHRWD